MRLTTAFFDAAKLLAFNDDLREGQTVLVRFPDRGSLFGVMEAIVEVVRVNTETVMVRADRDDAPFSLPRWTRGGTGCLRWSPNHGVFPESGIEELMHPEGLTKWRGRSRVET